MPGSVFTVPGLDGSGSRRFWFSLVRHHHQGASIESYQLAGYKVMLSLIRYDEAARMQVCVCARARLKA